MVAGLPGEDACPCSPLADKGRINSTSTGLDLAWQKSRLAKKDSNDVEDCIGVCFVL